MLTINKFFNMDPLEYNSNNYKQQVIDWAVRNPGALWQDTKEASDVRSWMEQNAPDDFASLYWNEDDTSKIDSRFIPMKARERRMEDAVRSRDKAVPYIAGALAAPVIAGSAISAIPYMSTGLDLLSTSKFGRGIAHGLNVLGNPAAAKTTAGSIGALGLDLSGLFAGLKGLSQDITNIRNGNYSWNQVPQTLLNGTVMLPGSSVLTRPQNWSAALNTSRGIYNNLRRNLNLRRPNPAYNDMWLDILDASPSELSTEQSAFKDALYGYRDKYLETHGKPQTVDEIKSFIGEMPDDQFGLLKNNFNSNIDDMVKETTYHKALSPEEIWKELPYMGKPETDLSSQYDIISEYYKSDVLPRVLENLRSSVPNFDQIEQQVIDLYSAPFNGVDMKIGYTGPGTGGFSKGTSFIRYSNKRGNPNLNTVAHEIHHSLRSRLKQILIDHLSKQKISLRGWDIPKTLESGDPDRNYQVLFEYTPKELEAMEPLAMTIKNSSDKTPVAEIGATLAGGQRFEMWLAMKNALGRSPTTAELNNAIQRMNYAQLAEQRNHLGYGNQIGSLLEESVDNFINNVNRKYNLWQRISNDRYNKLPFYERWFVKRPKIDWQEPSKLTFDARMKSNQELLDAWKKTLQTVGGFAGAGIVGNSFVNDPLSYNIEN